MHWVLIIIFGTMGWDSPTQRAVYPTENSCYVALASIRAGDIEDGRTLAYCKPKVVAKDTTVA